MVVVVVMVMVIMVTSKAVLPPSILSTVHMMFPTPRRAHRRIHVEGAYATAIAVPPRAGLSSWNPHSNPPSSLTPSLAVIRNWTAVGTCTTPTAPASLWRLSK